MHPWESSHHNGAPNGPLSTLQVASKQKMPQGHSFIVMTLMFNFTTAKKQTKKVCSNDMRLGIGGFSRGPRESGSLILAASWQPPHCMRLGSKLGDNSPEHY